MDGKRDTGNAGLMLPMHHGFLTKQRSDELGREKVEDRKRVPVEEKT